VYWRFESAKQTHQHQGIKETCFLIAQVDEVLPNMPFSYEASDQNRQNGTKTRRSFEKKQFILV